MSDMVRRQEPPGWNTQLCTSMQLLIPMLLASSVLAMGHAAASPRKPGARPMVMSTSLEEWEEGASHNLSAWRSAVFQETMKVYRRNTEAYVNRSLANRRQENEIVQNALFGMEPLRDPRGVYSIAKPVITCPPPGKLTKVGGAMLKTKKGQKYEDGYKYLCGVAQLTAPCLVLSLGSRGDTSFEKEILNKTPCTVATFDCSVNVRPTHARHKFYRKCIGSPQRVAKDGKNFVTWSQAIKLTGFSSVDVLKIDIEGYEYDVLSGLSDADYANLPRQIAAEIHTSGLYRGTPSHGKVRDFGNLLWPMQRMSLSQISLFFMHLASMGYGIVSRDDNPIYKSCTELTFVLIPPTMARR